MKPFSSLTARLVAIAAVQVVLLVIVALVIFKFTAPDHHPHGPPMDHPHGPPPDGPHKPVLGPLLTLLVSGAILIAGAIMTARWIVRPVKRLSTAVEAFGAGGDLRARAQPTVARGDELGELAHRFDDMAVRIQSLLASEKELLANVAHELRTPLARIGVALDLASEGNSDRARASLTEIAVDVAELETIVNDILTALRVDVGGIAALPLHKQTVEPATITASAVERMRGRHPDRPLEVDVAPGLPAIDVDPVLFRRVIDNLLENSHKYTPDRALAIRIDVTRVDNDVIFEIADKGVGMSAEELPRAFDPFWRSERSRNRATGGVGLGLTLVKRIVDAHGAGIKVTSDVGAGTTARITVPVAPT